MSSGRDRRGEQILRPAQSTEPKAEPVLVARLGTDQYLFPVGAQVRVGRDPMLELVSTNPLVTRALHGIITSDTGGAWYTDHSRRGTFLDGKKLRRPLRISSPVILKLGDPATGEELGITPPIPAARIERNVRAHARSARLRVIAVAGVAVVLLLGAVAWLTLGRAQSGAGSLSHAALTRAEAATVRILMGTPGSSSGSGSGTLISPDGLILTNTHVAQPRAPGQAIVNRAPGAVLPADPQTLTVEISTHPPAPVAPRYLVRPVAVDGYLDLSVVQIYATSDNRPVDPATLKLPYLETGDVRGLRLGQPVTVLGYPGISDSNSITVTTGVISAFIPDALNHVNDRRYQLETTARVAPGNSGGSAIDDSGRLIGIPSLSITGPGGEVSWRLRSVAQAAPLISAARSRSHYKSGLLTAPAQSQKVTAVGVGTTPKIACSGAQSLAGQPASAVFGVGYTGFPVGLDYAVVVAGPDGQPLLGAGSLPEGRVTSQDGCLPIAVSAESLGLPMLSPGRYQVQLLAGPNLDPVGTAATVAIGGPGPTG